MHRLVLSVLMWSAALLPPTARAQAVTDSAGVRLVRYPMPAKASEAALVKPVVSVDGGCEMNRVANVLMQSTGHIVVANAGNREFCVFDSQGRFVRKFGRSGEGPGEFRGILSVQLLRGDSILLVDNFLRRAIVFGPTGSVGRSFPIAAPDTGLGSNFSAVAMADGALLLGFSEFKRGPPRPEALMFRQRIFRTGPNGNGPTLIGSFTIGEHFAQQVAPERGGVAYYDLTFGRQFSAAPLGDGFLGGDESSFDVQEYTTDGRLRAIHRLSSERLPVTPADIAAYSESSLRAASGQSRASEERRVNEMPYPTHYPAYRRVLTDSIVEVIDPDRAVVLATRRFDDELRGFACPNTVFRYHEDDEGVPSIRVHSLRFARPQ